METSRKPFVIVVGVDYSTSSDLALERAFEVASKESDAHVHAVNVLRPVHTTPYDIPALPALPPLSSSEAFNRFASHVQTRLDEFKLKHQDQRPFARATCHVRFDAPAEQLAQIAVDLEADLVVVGTHGRRGISRLLMGSVAEGVVRLAPCPVLVVRPKSLPAPIPEIAPPCPRCVAARTKTQGETYWCEQHLERHGQRHTYHQGDRVSTETNFPLVFTR